MDEHKENKSEEAAVLLPEEDSLEKNKREITISIKTAIIIAAVIILGALAYVYRGLYIAATVDGSPISRLAVIRELEKGSGQAALDSLITQKLINNEADKKGIIISAEDIDAEMEKIKQEGVGLENALARGATMEDIRKQVIMQKQLGKLIGNKPQPQVTDEEVEQYITSNSITIPKGQEAESKNQIKAGLSQQKLYAEMDSLINSLKSQASIHYFVKYHSSTNRAR